MVTLVDVFTSLIVLGVFVPVAFVVVHLIGRYATKLARRTRTKVDDLIVAITKWPAYVAIVLVGANLSLRGLDIFSPYLLWIDRTFFVAWTIVGGYAGYKFIDPIIGHMAAARAETHAGLLTSLRTLGTIIKALVLVTVLLTLLGVFGIDIAPFVLGWGLLGFAIVLALQPILQDIITGLYVAFAQPYRVGDRVQLPSGEVCEVVEIKAQKTLLHNLIDRNYLSVANSDMVKMRVVNLPEGILKLDVPVHITQDTNVELAKKIAFEVLKNSPKIVNEPSPAVFVEELAGPIAKLRLSVWISDSSAKYEVLDHINLELRRRFMEARIRFPT